jgi:hypothetical protein
MTLRHALLAAVICSTATAFASDYITHGVDPGRTGWIKDEKVFTKANVGKMKLLWKVKLERDAQPFQPAHPAECHDGAGRA